MPFSPFLEQFAFLLLLQCYRRQIWTPEMQEHGIGHFPSHFGCGCIFCSIIVIDFFIDSFKFFNFLPMCSAAGFLNHSPKHFCFAYDLWINLVIVCHCCPINSSIHWLVIGICRSTMVIRLIFLSSSCLSSMFSTASRVSTSISIS